MQLEFNIYEHSYKKIYDYVEYCITEEYDGSSTYSYNATLHGIVSLIIRGTNSGYARDLMTLTIYVEDGSEMTVNFMVDSENGEDFVISFLKESKINTETLLEELEAKNNEDIRLMAEEYAAFHHGARTEKNKEAFDEEVDKFTRGITHMQ